MSKAHRKASMSALEWYIDVGVDEALAGAPVNRKGLAQKAEVQQVSAVAGPQAAQEKPQILGSADARQEAIKLANAANTREELEEAIRGFDGLAIKKTATNMVFCDGNPEAPVMLVGEAPGADEDRLGRPFVGVSGQLLDRILKCIGLDRTAQEPYESVYISNILNWRPPGNRTPSPGEIEVSLPFIEKHIMLVQPKILILCGGVSAKALLGRTEGVSRLRKTWHSYKPQTTELDSQAGENPTQALATYHPSYLLRTPSQKRAVWADMLMIQEKHKALNLK